MSEYTKACSTCKKEILMSNNTGKWLPFNFDNSPHRCFVKLTEKLQKPVTLEDLDLRVRMLESILLQKQPKK